MVQRYIADDEVILNLAGLRWVAKEDTQYVALVQKYILKWDYKGSWSYHEYHDKAKRDAIFDQARAALIPKEE